MNQPAPQPHKSKSMESRRVPRVPVNIPIRFVVAPNMRRQVGLVHQRVTGTLIDLGTLGIGMKAPLFLPRGSRINCKIPRNAIGKPTDAGELSFVVVVKNCRMTPGESSFRIGAEFARIAKRNTLLISSYVQKQLKSS